MNAPARLAPTMSNRRLMVLNFVRLYWMRHGASPSYGEIAAGVGCSRTRVKYAVRALVQSGQLFQEAGRARSLRLPGGDPILSEAEAVARLRAAGWELDEGARTLRVTNTTLGTLLVIDHP